jgi:murein DD-endopeptidase MepM/ murein hydrolase activator NlpD
MYERPFGPLRLTAFLVSVAWVAMHGTVSAQNANQGPLTLTVMDAPGSLKPGGVALISVVSTQDLTELTGEAAGRPVRFWRTASAREWNGLVGINLESAPGPVSLTIQGRAVTGATAATRVSLSVARYRFETRRLQVDPKLANPPQEEVARIKEEAKLMADAFTIVTAQRYWHGRFDAPVPGTATSSFGRLTITNGKPAGRHQGADFRAATGTPVKAPNAGRVVIARNLYFAGNTVIIDHGLGVFSLLAHLSRIDVAPGATVSRGDLVGESGATGRVTGPHLHWAVRFGEMTVDPLALVSALATQSDETVPHPAQ